MTRRFGLVTVGGLCYDTVLRVDGLPAADGKYPAVFEGHLPGGFLANAACAAARLGVPAAYLGWVGDDGPGEMLRRDFAAYGVNTVGLRTMADAPTPFTVILVAGAERVILLPSTPYSAFEPDAGQLALAGEADAVLTYPRDPAWCAAWAGAVRAGGGVLALDVETMPAPDDADRLDTLRLADVIFISERALAPAHMPFVRALASGRWVIVTAGAAGAYGYSGAGEPVHVPARRVPVVDTTGAGDCYHAALLAARAGGEPLADAMRFATAAAALKIGHIGARGGLPTRADVERLLLSDREVNP